MNNTADIDERWLKNLKAGDEKAFKSLFDRYNRLLYVLAYRYFQNSADAQDAVQNTLMKVWENRLSLQFDTVGQLRSLLFTILKNYILNEFRHQQLVATKHEELKADMGIESEDISDWMAHEQLKQKLYLEIEKLPEQKREICKMKILKGMKNQEIAEQLQISIPTVKSHYTESVKRLRQRLDKWLVWLLFFIT